MTKCNQVVAVMSTLLVIAVIFFLWVFFLNPLLSTQDYYEVEVDTGKIWYGKIIEQDKKSISLGNLYHFYDGNLSQLVRHDPKLTGLKKINRNKIISINKLDSKNPVLRVIKNHEKRYR
jgi:hypothetical protein